jgi:hypothetical protein
MIAAADLIHVTRPAELRMNARSWSHRAGHLIATALLVMGASAAFAAKPPATTDHPAPGIGTSIATPPSS